MIFLLLFPLPSQVAVTKVKLPLKGLNLSAGGIPPDCHAKAATTEAIKTVAQVDAVHSVSVKSDLLLLNFCTLMSLTWQQWAPDSEKLRGINNGYK